jgi:hypothetical protein
MSPIKETAIRMIREVPDDQVAYIIHIIKGINGLSQTVSAPATNRQTALKHLQQFRGKIPPDLDYAAELETSRTERYAGIS